MKRSNWFLLLVCAINLVVLVANAEQQSNPVESKETPPIKVEADASKRETQAAKPVGKRLSDAYAKAALRALKAIQGDGTEISYRNEQVFVNRITQTAIDDADVEATTQQELDVTKLLNSVYLQKLMNNSSRKLLGYIPNSAKLTKLVAGETACFDAIDAMLRSRIAVPCPSCNSIHVAALDEVSDRNSSTAPAHETSQPPDVSEPLSPRVNTEAQNVLLTGWWDGYGQYDSPQFVFASKFYLEETAGMVQLYPTTKNSSGWKKAKGALPGDLRHESGKMIGSVNLTGRQKTTYRYDMSVSADGSEMHGTIDSRLGHYNIRWIRSGPDRQVSLTPLAPN